jgi:hypothetical protein
LRGRSGLARSFRLLGVVRFAGRFVVGGRLFFDGGFVGWGLVGSIVRRFLGRLAVGLVEDRVLFRGRFVGRLVGGRFIERLIGRVVG